MAAITARLQGGPLAGTEHAAQGPSPELRIPGRPLMDPISGTIISTVYLYKRVTNRDSDLHYYRFEAELVS